MQHDGGFHLDNVRYPQEISVMETVLDLEQIPQAASQSNWFRRMGNHAHHRTPIIYSVIANDLTPKSLRPVSMFGFGNDKKLVTMGFMH